MYSPFDIFLTITEGNRSIEEPSTQALMAKSFDGFLNNGTTLEPLYWYPSWSDIYSIYQFNVSLAQDNSTGLYLNINATSSQTNLNATNISPVFFQSVNSTNIQSG